MGFKIAKRNIFPIGLDLGFSAVKLAQLRQVDRGLELIAAGAMAIEHDGQNDLAKRIEKCAPAIRSILKSNDFNSRQCALSLPADATFVHHVKMPKLPAGEIPKALEMELQGKLPYPTDQAIIRHIIAGDVFADGETKQEVIVVAANRKVVNACLTLARRTHLDVTAVNIEPCAIVECFSRLFRGTVDTGRTILYVDIGAINTQVVLAHGHQMVFARNLPMGGKQLDQAVANGLGVSIEQAQAMRRDLSPQSPTAAAAEEELVHLLDGAINELTAELTQCLRYYESVFHNRSIERAVFLGGQAHDKRLCQTIAQKLNLPAQIGDPLVRIERSEGAGLSSGLDQKEPQPDWAVAIGLSLGAGCAA